MAMSGTTVKTETLKLKVSDGTEMQVFVARPSTEGHAPGLMIFQEAFGVNEHIRNVTKRFAENGYVAIAPELFHRTAPPGFEGPYSDFSKVQEHYQAVTTKTLEPDIKATYDWLAKDPQVKGKPIGGIGYCMGGKVAFFANATVPIMAASSFYGGGIAEDLLSYASKQNAPILLGWGGKDNHIGIKNHRAVADAVREAGKPFVDIEFSQADHGFLCEDRPAYHPTAARQAWALTLEFFAEHLQNIR